MKFTFNINMHIKGWYFIHIKYRILNFCPESDILDTCPTAMAPMVQKVYSWGYTFLNWHDFVFENFIEGISSSVKDTACY